MITVKVEIGGSSTQIEVRKVWKTRDGYITWGTGTPKDRDEVNRRDPDVLSIEGLIE